MGFINALRDRVSSDPGAAAPGGGGQASDTDEPVAGYARLRDGDVVGELSKHSQVELEAIESYERAHEDRGPVLAKLRYLRGAEPFPGYDALSVEEVVTALEDADLETVTRVRGYERKFANRRAVLEVVDRVHRTRRDERPATTPQRYQAASASQPR